MDIHNCSTKTRKARDLYRLKSLKGRLDQDAEQYEELRERCPELPEDLYSPLQSELEECIEALMLKNFVEKAEVSP